MTWVRVNREIYTVWYRYDMSNAFLAITAHEWCLLRVQSLVWCSTLSHCIIVSNIVFTCMAGCDYRREWKRYLTKLDITFHARDSQLHKAVVTSSLALHNELCRHHQNFNRLSDARSWRVKIVVSVVNYALTMSFRKQNNACTVVTNCSCAHSMVIYIYIYISIYPSLLRKSMNKRQNNSPVST